jgi:hypothetical protein
MIKIKGGNQIENLTCDHESLEKREQMRYDWSVLYVVEKIFLKVIKNFPHIFKKNDLRKI